MSQGLREQHVRNVLDEDGETLLDYCNDCGILTLAENELCGRCYDEQQRAEEWEKMHPELRCPPRE